MSHEKRMHMIDEQGAGGFALEEGHKLDSSAVEKIQETVDVSEIVAKYDKESVYRSFKGWLDIFIKILCIAFSAFHLYTAATTPFAPQIQRAVHLGFVLTLIYLLYPARATGNMNKLAWYDAILAIAGAVVCGYIVWQYDIIVLDAGPATELDFIMGCASILLVLEATRRIVGIPITLVAVVFLLYAKFGNLIPGMLGHPGFSVQRIVSHMYLTTEGLFGMPLGVSASFVFLFILFGAFLHSTGLGKFFIDLALAAAGRYVGGPAKVAVLASGFFGTISGSSVANTVSTGTFTIPLMKSVGYRGAFAGAVEAASSTGGQIMPPIMGAAAFIMAQFLGVGYVEIAKAALVPALLYYLAVGFMVHMEAKRLGLKGIPKERLPRTWVVLRQGGYLLIPIIVLIYMLMQGYTPLKAAYYCIVTTVVISLVAENWKTWHGARYSNENVMSALAQTNFLSLKGVLQAMENGGRLALGVAAACACTGFVIGVVTLTGPEAGQRHPDHLGRQLCPDPAADHAGLHRSGHGPAHHGQVHRAGHHRGPGHHALWRACHGGAPLHPVLRHPGRPDAPCGTGRLRRGRDRAIRAERHRLHGGQAGFGRLPDPLHLLLQPRPADDRCLRLGSAFLRFHRGAGHRQPVLCQRGLLAA